MREQEMIAKIEWLRQEIKKDLDSGPATQLDMNEIKQLAQRRLEMGYVKSRDLY